MTSLTERIKAAGPCRELDYAIFCNAVFPNHKHKWDPSDNNHRYTSSIDAAMTLVPEGWGWTLTHWGCFRLWEIGDGMDVTSKAKTPALAICAAALRARGVE